MKERQPENRADTCRWQSGEDRQGVYVALVQNSQHDVNRYDSGQQQPAFIGERITKSGSRALKARGDALGHANFASCVINLLYGIPQGRVRSKIEGDGRRGELALVIEHK